MKKPTLKIYLWAINDSLELMQQMCSNAIQTADIFDLNIELLGIGQPFKGHKHRLWIAYDLLKATPPSELVILMDGSDTLFNEYEGNIVQRFLDLNCSILISAEKNFTHQYFEFKDKFDQLESEYRYVNAGTMMGFAGDLLFMWEEMMELESTFPQANDQGLLGVWAYHNLHDTARIKLDTNCDIFWVTAGESRTLKTASAPGTTIYNPRTKTKPAIIHVTGNKDPQIMPCYLAGFQNIVYNSKLPSYRLIILSPIVNDDEYLLWVPKKKEYDENRPVWYHDEHPNIISFFYGRTNRNAPHVIQADHFYEAMYQVKQNYYFDYIIHVPKGHIFYHHELLHIVQSDYNGEKTRLLKGTDYATHECFIFTLDKYYLFHGLTKVDERDPNIVQDYMTKRKAYKKYGLLEDYRKNYPEFPIDVISLGGWCGTAVASIDLNIRVEAYPFCMIHSTLDCVLEMVNGNPGLYFEEGAHTIMPHHDMEDPVQKLNMAKRIDKFLVRLQNPKPILFVRTIINPNHQEGIKKMLELVDLINHKFDRDDIYILVFHDQKVKTTKIKMLRSNIMLWAVEGGVDWKIPNREEIFKGYRRIIRYGLNDNNWKLDVPQLKSHTIISHHSTGIHKALYQPS